MKVLVLLCDSAQVAEGKLNILGGGWSICGPGPVQMALAIKIDVPWDQANRPHSFSLWLQEADGQPVTLPGPEGDQPLRSDGQFETGRPAGLPEGVALDVPLALNFGALPLPPRSRFTWKLEIDGDTEEGWEVSFTTRAEGQRSG
jgi:Family of unknown function (DUF6941)